MPEMLSSSYWNNAWMILDGQWGSTGKGLLAGYLARRRSADAVVCNFGPNAGHTFIYDDGRVVMTRMLPTGGVVSPSVETILMGPGSIIDPDILLEELGTFHDLLKGKRLVIHPRAAVVLPRHREQERATLGRISSTQKGTGAAQAEKVMRLPDVVAEVALRGTALEQYILPDKGGWFEILAAARRLQVESAQGYELGVNCGSSYPYCTARDVTPATVLNDCGLPHWAQLSVFVVVRTFPIRVGHQFDAEGNKVGDSGPVYADQRELTWDELGVPLERTTVTQKVRRVFTFSGEGYRRMIDFVRPAGVFLNFVNYLEPNPSWHTPATAQMVRRLNAIAHDVRALSSPVEWIGVGPREHDVLSRVTRY
jgi:adenylosuccinate synthase